MEILHITTQVDWQSALDAGAYVAESLASEGFIHCSQARQVTWVANNFYAGQSGLVLLHIDPDKLASELRWDPAENDRFPHVYGPINLEAVIAVEDFTPGPDGKFRYP